MGKNRGSATFLLALLSVALGTSAANGAEPFLWGVSNASFQTEGSPAPSDWTQWTHTPGRIADATNADRATDFWNLYDEDFALAQAIGLNAFRLSVAWERIEPAPGRWDEAALDHYVEMLLTLRAHGLEPVVTLLHYVLPAWLADRGGLLNADFPRYFADYAAHVVERLSSAPVDVRYWITLNEAEVLALASYVTGDFPPGRKGDVPSYGHAMANLALAHLQAIRAIDGLELEAKLQISVAKNWVIFAPANPDNPLDQKLVEWTQQLYNQQFLDAVRTGRVRIGFPGLEQDYGTVAPASRPFLDFVGINYYTRNRISAAPPFLLQGYPGPLNDLGWEIYPEGFKQAIIEANRETGLPVMVTENGIADAADSQRAKFLADHLAALAKARSAGVPVLGYLHWSLTDNFEWAKGLTPRFGLVEIDYSTLERKPRPSYFAYGKLVQQYRDANF